MVAARGRAVFLEGERRSSKVAKWVGARWGGMSRLVGGIAARHQMGAVSKREQGSRRDRTGLTGQAANKRDCREKWARRGGGRNTGTQVCRSREQEPAACA